MLLIFSQKINICFKSIIALFPKIFNIPASIFFPFFRKRHRPSYYLLL
ncbi:hypothetical protein B4135_2230 [Caldibacillus debilis]|uniref:Uncharacterized protein n=1 Tax=Caldibacillus debilis TaxID=301148 RepID=A0A150M2Y7_9BACI|nr:hypothetical protein B4135_2230 [Caldibacillus debilis]